PRRSRGPSSSARRLRRLDCELRPATDIRSARPYLPVAPPRRAARRGGSRSDCPRMRVGRSLDHLIRPRQQRRGDRQAERLGGLEVDDQLELGRLLDWEIGRLRTLANPGDIGGSTHCDRRYVWTERHEATVINNLSETIDNRQPICSREVDELSP